MYNTLVKKLKWLNSDTLINRLLKHHIHIICTWSFQSSLSVTDVEYLWMAPVCNRGVLKNILNTRKKKKYHLWLSWIIVGYKQFMVSWKLEPLSLFAIFTNFFWGAEKFWRVINQKRYLYQKYRVMCFLFTFVRQLVLKMDL